MNRRTFISLGVSAAAIPLMPGCRGDSPWLDVLAKPGTVSQFCDKEELLAIAADFEKTRPREYKRGRLQDLILNDQTFDNYGQLTAKLETKKKEEFENGDTLVLNGWVLSLTEARQCALYAITAS